MKSFRLKEWPRKKRSQNGEILILCSVALVMKFFHHVDRYNCPVSRYDYVDLYQPLPSLDEAHEAQHAKVVTENPPKKVFADNKAHSGAFDNYKPCEVFNNYMPREAFDGHKARETFDGRWPREVAKDYKAREMETRPPFRRHSYNQSSHERFDCRHTISRSVMPARPVMPDFSRCSPIPRQNKNCKKSTFRCFIISSLIWFHF